MGACSITPGIQYVLPTSSVPRQTHPLFADRCQAGFPSPARDYVEAELDLNEYCIRIGPPRTSSGLLASR